MDWHSPWNCWRRAASPACSLASICLTSLASVLMAPLGAAATHRLNVRQLERVFAVVLQALA